MMSLDGTIRSVCALGVAVCLFVIADGRPLTAHGSEARYVQVLPWTKARFARVLAVGRSELGVPGSRNPTEIRTIADRSCVVGPLVAFDVEDAYAFDIDEPVTLRSLLHLLVHTHIPRLFPITFGA